MLTNHSSQSNDTLEALLTVRQVAPVVDANDVGDLRWTKPVGGRHVVNALSTSNQGPAWTV